MNYYIKLPPLILLWPLIGSLLIFFLSQKYFTKDLLHRFNLIMSLSAFISIFLLGGINIQVSNISSSKNHLLRIENDIEYYTAEVIDAPDTSGKYCKVISKVKRIRFNGKWQHSDAKVLMFLPKTEPLIYGQSLVVYGKPQKIAPPLNPDEFDYQQYMYNKGISHQHFIKSGSYIGTDLHNQGASIKGLSLRIRDHLARIIDSSFSDRNTKALMLALMTGQREYFNEDIYNSFIQAGIIHVLAISGLHVGIIYMFLIFILNPLSRKKWSKTFSYCLKISILISFAFITGLSPSVMRATLMFIIMIIGKMLNRNTHILNSVFLSFFLLLVIDPFKLFDVGFQLSYSAVLGIILFQPIIYKLIHVRLIFINWIWQLTSVSIAAQLGTLPFSLFYFKQFPTYFLLGNIFAIPFISVVTILGFILVLTSFVPDIAYLFSVVIEFLSDYFIRLISILQSLPFGMIKPLQIGFPQALMMAVLILSIYFTLRTRIWKVLLMSLGCVIGIIGIDINDKKFSSKEKRIIIYNTPKISCMELVDGNTSLILVEDLSNINMDKINYHVMNHIDSKKRKTEFTDYSEISKKLPVIYRDGYFLICWNGKSIAILKGDADIRELEGIDIDYLLISNVWQNTEDLRKIAHNASKIICDSSNPYVTRMTEADPFIESIHIVPIHGPFIEQFN